MSLRRSFWLRAALCLALAALLTVDVLGLRPLIVLGSSMEPALKPWQIALVRRHYYRSHPLACGDVVVFHWKGQRYVKRVYALPGDSVTLLDHDGCMWPSSADLREKERRLVGKMRAVQIRSVTVPVGHFFCLGDNRSASIDSRELGPIPMTAILGRVEPLLPAAL